MPSVSRTDTDVHGVIAEYFDVGAKSTLKGRRRRQRPGAPDAVDGLPADWIALLVRWQRRGARSKWETLVKDAGAARVETVHTLIEWLLKTGWIALTETRSRGRWLPVWVEFPQLAALRAQLGLTDPEAIADQWQRTRQCRLDHPELILVASALDSAPPGRALVRHALLVSLDAWRNERRYGTRRDFALFARGDTKAITAAEWNWLESVIDPAAFGVERHAPFVLMRAPLVLATPAGRIPLSAAPDCQPISMETLAASVALEGKIGCWRLVENRTSFERVARRDGAADGVLWLPGFPPTWWQDAIARLLTLAPAPALIACDPDPAGVEIALTAGKLWTARGLAWEPWKMGAGDLARLTRRKPLSDRDGQRLAKIQTRLLPPTLAELVSWMDEHGEKGEQEGIL